MTESTQALVFEKRCKDFTPRFIAPRPFLQVELMYLVARGSCLACRQIQLIVNAHTTSQIVHFYTVKPGNDVLETKVAL